MSADALFPLTVHDVALTPDEWYTPRWLFAAAGIMFDMDVAAPVDPAYRTCPAKAFLTAVEDGLRSPWEGVVWCNPPYSQTRLWAERLAGHDQWMTLLRGMHENHWLGKIIKAADVITFPSVKFTRADGSTAQVLCPLILAGRGAVCADAVTRVAAADKYMQGAFIGGSSNSKSPGSR